MIKVIYPQTKPAIKTDSGKEQIFCLIRKKWLLITPEEWVRQNFLLYLTEVLQYPASLIAVEKKIRVGELEKRFDIVVYDRDTTKPLMVVECKEMNVPLSTGVLNQVLRYNIHLDAVYLIITNGSYTAAFERKEDQFSETDDLPVFIK